MTKQKWFVLVTLLVLSGLWVVSTFSKRSATANLDQQLFAIKARIDGLQAEVTKLSNQLEQASTIPKKLHTVASVTDALDKLGETPTATKLAETLATMDTWTVKAEQEEEFRQCKRKLASQLRQEVKAEVTALQNKALEAASGADGAKKLSEAGALLALYPMSEDKAVVEEAKKLSEQQSQLTIRLEVLRRQRYNRWAVEKIAEAIDGYHESESWWGPIEESQYLIDSLVETLGEVDPGLLEPVALERYNYVVTLAKRAISQEDAVYLAKRLTDPSIKRKTLEDF